jgi:hypothetical protein
MLCLTNVLHWSKLIPVALPNSLRLPKKMPPCSGLEQERKGWVAGGLHLQYMLLNAGYSAEIPCSIQGLAMAK